MPLQKNLCFPKDAETRKQWKRAIPRFGVKLNDCSYVCELHFLPDEIIKTKVIEYGTHSQTINLKCAQRLPKAIPSQFPSEFKR